MSDNRYVASVVTSLLAHVPDLDRTRAYSISETLDLLATEPQPPEQQLLILDRFEEILTLDPNDFSGQKDFFLQLGKALVNQDRWALIAMREDYMGGLDRFLRYVPGQLRATFRLTCSTGRPRAARSRIPPTVAGSTSPRTPPTR
jgi:hypothetical protein